MYRMHAVVLDPADESAESSLTIDNQEFSMTRIILDFAFFFALFFGIVPYLCMNKPQAISQDVPSGSSSISASLTLIRIMRHEHHGSSLVNASCAPCGDKLHRHHKQHFMILLTLTLKLTLTHPKVPTPTEPTSHMAMLVCTSWPSCILRTSGANPCTTAIRHTDRVDGGRPCETQKTLDGQLASNESQHICQSRRPGTLPASQLSTICK